VQVKRLRILGFGRIGQALARPAALGFGMPVLYHNPQAVGLHGLGSRAPHVPLLKLLREIEIVAVTPPLVDESRGLRHERMVTESTRRAPAEAGCRHPLRPSAP